MHALQLPQDCLDAEALSNEAPFHVEQLFFWCQNIAKKNEIPEAVTFVQSKLGFSKNLHRNHLRSDCFEFQV